MRCGRRAGRRGEGQAGGARTGHGLAGVQGARRRTGGRAHAAAEIHAQPPIQESLRALGARRHKAGRNAGVGAREAGGDHGGAGVPNAGETLQLAEQAQQEGEHHRLHRGRHMGARRRIRLRGCAETGESLFQGGGGMGHSQYLTYR